MKFDEIFRGLIGERSDRGVAIALGVSPQTITNWKNGVSRPDWEQLRKLTTILDCSIYDLFGEADRVKELEAQIAELKEDFLAYIRIKKAEKMGQ